MARAETSPQSESAQPGEVTGVPQPRGTERTLSGVSEPEFRDYVRARRRALLRTAYLLTRNEADAEDLVQAALAKTYLAADRIEDRSALDGYVRRAIVNPHIPGGRRRGVGELPTDEPRDGAVADHGVSSDLH